VRLRPEARIAIIGAGPSGLVTAKYALEAGFDATVFEASDDLGGQWHAGSAHSGVWPGMVTNTSRAMTAFSDLGPPVGHPLHPTAGQMHAYLHTYADRFGVTPRIRLHNQVRNVVPGWRVDGEPFDAVVVASGRFRKPRLPPGMHGFRGEILHAFDYPGADHFRARRTLVYGNGVSGVEIASDIATVAPVISAFRKPRYVIQKVVDGVSSDWQWYTLFGALQRRDLPRDQFAQLLRRRVVRVAGDPADFGAPAPDADILTAGVSLCQGYLRQIADGYIGCRPGISGIDGRTVVFTDGASERVQAIVCATGYDLDLPYLPEYVRTLLGTGPALHLRTLHPDVPNFAVVGQFLLQGPYFPILELQARWIVALWAGDIEPPDETRMRRSVAAPPPPLDTHDVLASTLAEESGVAPNLLNRPELAEALMFGPMLPPRYRLDGPGATADAAQQFTDQLSASPRCGVEQSNVDELRILGLGEVADVLASRLDSTHPPGRAGQRQR
jgi:dimethylaniline monooxygenase (N-oxide forming)